MPHQIKTQQVFLSFQFWNWSVKFDYWWGDILGFRPLDRYRIKLNQPVPSSSRQEHIYVYIFFIGDVLGPVKIVNLPMQLNND